MKLSEKGRFAPPPKLKGPAQHVAETVASWDDVHARAHWLLGDETQIDGADFYLGEEELGHIHLYSEAHVMFSRAIASALIEAGLASTFEWSRSTVAFAIESKDDTEHALWLFRLSYERRRGASNEQLLARIDERTGNGRRARTKRAQSVQASR